MFRFCRLRLARSAFARIGTSTMGSAVKIGIEETQHRPSLERPFLSHVLLIKLRAMDRSNRHPLERLRPNPRAVRAGGAWALPGVCGGRRRGGRHPHRRLAEARCMGAAGVPTRRIGECAAPALRERGRRKGRGRARGRARAVGLAVGQSRCRACAQVGARRRSAGSGSARPPDGRAPMQVAQLLSQP